VLTCALAAGIALLPACSGGTDDDDGNIETIGVEGLVVAGPVSGAQVTFQTGAGRIIAGPAVTDGDGHYRIAVPVDQLDQPLWVVAEQGSYVDEATGASTSLQQLAAYVEVPTEAGRSISLTAGSTIVAALVADHGLSHEQALHYFEQAFGYRPDLALMPAAMTEAQPDPGSPDSLAGMRAAGFSQLLHELGLPESAHYPMLLALASDLADGSADGRRDAQPVAIAEHPDVTLPQDVGARFGRALINFAANSERNRSGLQPGALPGIPGAGSAWSDSYRFELVAPAAGARVGKSLFTLRVLDHAGQAVAGVVPAMTIRMYMAAGHVHSTPSAGCSETDSNGDALCTPYFLMASSMANGTHMGHWRLTFALDGETVDFFPEVSMAMGDTQRVQLKGTGTDLIGGMNGMTTARAYNLFLDSLSVVDMAAEDPQWRLGFYVSAQESMMSFPPLMVGWDLNPGTAFELQPDTITLEASLDGTTWIDAVSMGDGVWSVSGLALIEGDSNLVSLRLTVNGEVKTTNGAVASIENQAAVFDISPGGAMMSSQ
jgi:hypothetical protein